MLCADMLGQNFPGQIQAFFDSNIPQPSSFHRAQLPTVGNWKSGSGHWVRVRLPEFVVLVVLSDQGN